MHFNTTKKIFAYIKILRPSNFVISFFSIYVAIIIADERLALNFHAILSAFAGALIGSAGMVINDYFDFEIDKINRPERSIPSGLISKTEALIYYSLLNIMSISILLFSNLISLIIACVSLVLIFLYSYLFKKILLVGNIVVASLTGIAFIFGGAIAGNIGQLIIPAIFAFEINFIREIVKDLEDIPGDKEAGLITFPIKFGQSKTIKLIFYLTIILIGSTFIPFVFNIYKIEFFIIALFGVDLILVHCLKLLFRNYSQQNLRKISNLMKLSMTIGLIGIYLGIK